MDLHSSGYSFNFKPFHILHHMTLVSCSHTCASVTEWYNSITAT